MAIARAGTETASTTAGMNGGTAGASNACELLWHALIDGCWPESSSWSGQWHFVGSGQQHSTVIEIVRSCDTGSANITITAIVSEYSALFTHKTYTKLPPARQSIAFTRADHMRRPV